jgi:hypothetical protein
MRVEFTIALLFALVAIFNLLQRGSCVECGGRTEHKPGCRSQGGGGAR